MKKSLDSQIYDENTIIIKDKIYIPVRHIAHSIAKQYHRRLYDEKECQFCENKSNKHNDICEACPAYHGWLHTAREVSVNGIDYYGLPLGERSKIPEKFGIKYGNFRIIDKRTESPFRYDVKMIESFKLREYQVPAVNTMVKKKHGILISPPRSGKCVIGGTIICTDSGIVSFSSVFRNKRKPKVGEAQTLKIKSKIMTSEGLTEVKEYTRFSVNETVSVRTSENIYLRGTPDHPILILDQDTENCGTLQWRNLEDVKSGDYLAVSLGNLPTIAKAYKVTYKETEIMLDNDWAELFAYFVNWNVVENTSVENQSWKLLIPDVFMDDFISIYSRLFSLPVDTQKTDTSSFVFIEDENVIQTLSAFGLYRSNVRVPNSLCLSNMEYMRVFLLRLFTFNTDYLFASNNPVVAQGLQTILIHFKVLTRIRKNKNNIKEFELHPLLGKLFSSTRKLTPSTLDLPPNIRCSQDQADYLRSKNIYFSRVTITKRVEKPILVYDASVERNHYLSSGIVSHNTPMMLNTAINLGERTLVLAKQNDYLDQFLNHVEDFSNLPRLEEKNDKKLFGYLRKPSDYKNFQIAVSTYHQFLPNNPLGRKRLAAAMKNFSTILVDEAHTANSLGFAKVVASFPAKAKMGFTADNRRKDKRHFIMREIIGPNQYVVQKPELKPSIIIEDCDFVHTKSAYKGKSGYTLCCKFLGKHPKRRKLILQRIGEDLKAGHSIVIPMLFREQTTDLVHEINELYAEDYGTYNSISGQAKTVAAAFLGGAKDKDKRENILDLARNRKIRVVVGTRSLLQLGLNVVSWSALYYVMPSSNRENWKQESSRVLTPDDTGKKKDPIIRMFVDKNVKLALDCWGNTYNYSLQFKYVISAKEKEKADSIFRLKSNVSSYETEGVAPKTSLFRNKFNPDTPYDG